MFLSMRTLRFVIFALLLPAVCALVCVPARAQTAISAPAGWTSQTRAGGAQTFSPPDLRAGEVFSVTVYSSASLDGKTPEDYVRTFAGAVGQKPGQLDAPLKLQTREGQTVLGMGVYHGPNETRLGVVFVGVSLDGGANVHVSRTLYSNRDLLDRYLAATGALTKSLAQRAANEAGSNLHTTPPAVKEKLKTVGGPLVPGIYAGNQYHGQELRFRFRLHIFPTGEYRLTDENDRDLKRRFFDEEVGTVAYNRSTGQLDAGHAYDLRQWGSEGRVFCYYGRNADNKPAIYAEDNVGYETVTYLVYAGPPNKRLSESQEEWRKAEANRYKWVTQPGKGVPNAQIAAILHHYDVQFHPGGMGLTTQTTDQAYLLLKNGTVYAGLPVPPGEFDVIRSRQNEPAKWGKWRQVGNRYQVSWEGAPYQPLPGSKVLPAPAQLKLNGYYRAASSTSTVMSSSLSIWGVTFDKDGRFRKTSSGSSIIGSPNAIGGVTTTATNENGTSVAGENFAITSKKKNNPLGDREGDYSLNGYTLTLRYDNGRVERLPFFFRGPSRNELWFEGSTLGLSDKE